MCISKFTAGLITGAIAGILLAPDKGAVTREKIADMADQCKDQINRLLGHSNKLDALADFLSEPLEGLDEDTRHRILTILEEARQ